ncbi:hypothetical protein CampHawk_167 [Bacillus phage CampHawk]|uniref:Uncharacterized protein n=1 Tax=Bacillus phage CampHawk TaxID=1406783 RepID=U5PSY9_9CAUD|nr:hypothetical protein CampHawk_167 [Bacillus phage CampHawk]AGY47045.1 hypothetical protein CampHawk_167 [Bacillus phage CampHawk]
MEKLHDAQYLTHDLIELTKAQSDALKNYFRHHDGDVYTAVGYICQNHGGLQGPEGAWGSLNEVPQSDLVQILLRGVYNVQPTYIQWLEERLEYFRGMEKEDKYETYGEVEILEEAIDRFQEAREQGTLY